LSKELDRTNVIAPDIHAGAPRLRATDISTRLHLMGDLDEHLTRFRKARYEGLFAQPTAEPDAVNR
jgi:hypothetical protein